MRRNKNKKYLLQKYKRLTHNLTNPKRFKDDGFVMVQYKLHSILEELEFKKDLWKYNEWWDLYHNTKRIVIKIVKDNETIDAINIMKYYGWEVLTITFDEVKSDQGIKKLMGMVKTYLKRDNFVEGRAKELNRDVPKSEVWFRSKIEQEPFFKDMRFEYNKPMFGRYIFDAFSKKYRLCIEVDGSIHDTDTQIVKDDRKDNVTRVKGFHIVRIKAFDDKSYNEAIGLIQHVVKNKRSRNFKLEIQEDINSKIQELEKKGKLGF